MIDRIRKTKSERATSVAVIVLALLMGGQYVYLLSGVQNRAECQQEERGRLAGLSDDNQNALILGVARLTTAADAGKKPTPAEQAALERDYRGLFTTFTQEAARIKAARDALQNGEVCD